MDLFGSEVDIRIRRATGNPRVEQYFGSEVELQPERWEFRTHSVWLIRDTTVALEQSEGLAIVSCHMCPYIEILYWAARRLVGRVSVSLLSDLAT